MIPTGAPLIPFIKDILCLILKVLGCLNSQLDTIANVMSGLGAQIQTAETAGNTDQLAALKCSQENANRAAQSALKAIEPIGALLDMVKPVMQLAGQKPIAIEGVGDGTDAESLKNVVSTLKGVAEGIKIVTDALGGCDS